MIGLSPRSAFAMIGCLCGMASAGCGRGLETEYGLSQGKSINGAGVLAEMFREQGDEVRTAFRLTEQVGDWADVIVRLSPRPGLPGQAEGDWYIDWLMARAGRRLVYVVRDFDAEEEYWGGVIDQMGPSAEPDERERAEMKLENARGWVADLPEKVKDPADAHEWFRIDQPINPPRICKAIGGPWSDGVSAPRAGITVHEPFKEGGENVMLTGDGHPLIVDWPISEESRVLALANGSLVLNASLVNPARRRLVARIIEWTRPEADGARRVAFVDGRGVLADSSGPPSIWDLMIRVASFRWVAIQMGILGLFACLARAARLGRPRPEPSEGLDRPSAHAEALGELLARTRGKARAAESIEHYRAWRHGRSGES
jgi:hypothetical protein